jgi:hypothetical protein
MMKHIICIGVAVIGIISLVYAGEPVKVGFNGESWKTIFDAERMGDEAVQIAKVSFVRGIYEGVCLMGSDTARDSFYYDLGYTRLIGLVDEFYRDEQNKAIPVVYALSIISLELKGADPAVIEDLLQDIRQGSAPLEE